MKLKDVDDVRIHISKNFFINEVSNIQKEQRVSLARKVDSARVKECVMIDREKYIKNKESEKSKKDKRRIKKKCIISEGRL
jgi:hypothetical protein